MAKQSIAKPTRSITSALLLVALLLPVILYVCVFWRSGVFSSVSDISGFFASGTYSDAEPFDVSSITVNTSDISSTGLTVTWDPDTLTLTVNGECSKAAYLRILFFPSPDIVQLTFSADVNGVLPSSSFFYFTNAGVTDVGSKFSDSISDYSVIFGDPVECLLSFGFYLRTRVGSYNNVVLQFTKFEVSRFFGDHPGITHSPGSFGEFLCNNFTVSEVNELVARPVLYGVGSLNNGYVSSESQYNIYVICAYFTYVIFVYLVFLIVKLLTFIPCVIIKYVNKATGGDHFG